MAVDARGVHREGRAEPIPLEEIETVDVRRLAYGVTSVLLTLRAGRAAPADRVVSIEFGTRENARRVADATERARGGAAAALGAGCLTSR